MRVLTIEEATLAYRSSRNTLVKAIKNGSLPGYRLKKHWYTFPPEIAFAGVIGQYHRNALIYKTILTTREIADIFGVTPSNVRQWVLTKQLPPGQTINGAKMWDVATVREFLRKREGREDKKPYFNILVNWSRKRLRQDPLANLRSVQDLDELLAKVMQLPEKEQVEELKAIYAAADLLAQTKAVSRLKS